MPMPLNLSEQDRERLAAAAHLLNIHFEWSNSLLDSEYWGRLHENLQRYSQHLQLSPDQIVYSGGVSAVPAVISRLISTSLPFHQTEEGTEYWGQAINNINTVTPLDLRPSARRGERLLKDEEMEFEE